MAVKTFDELAEATTLAGTDKVAMWASAAAKTISVSNFILSSPNGGLVEKEAANTFTADQTLLDSTKLTFGTGGDADIWYDGEDLQIDPRVVGTGHILLAQNSLKTVGNVGNVGIGALEDDVDAILVIKDRINDYLTGLTKVRGSIVDGQGRMGYSVDMAANQAVQTFYSLGAVDFVLEGDSQPEHSSSIRFTTIVDNSTGVGTEKETLILDKVGNLEITTAALKMHEMTAPLTADIAANSVVIYAEDNGSGKTKLMAKFSSGTAVELAIEP